MAGHDESLISLLSLRDRNELLDLSRNLGWLRAPKEFQRNVPIPKKIHHYDDQPERP
jgi:hypothetical protein